MLFRWRGKEGGGNWRCPGGPDSSVCLQAADADDCRGILSWWCDFKQVCPCQTEDTKGRTKRERRDA